MKRALIYSVLTALSLMGNLLYQIVLTGAFGAGARMDILLASATLPQFLETVILGSLGYVLIPRLVRAGEQGRGIQAETIWQVTLLAVACFALAGGVGSALAVPIFRWTNPGFHGPEIALGAHLMRLQWVTEVFMAARVCFTAVAVARGRLVRAGLAPVAGSVLSLAALAMMIPSQGIVAGALGALVSVVVQCVMLWPFDGIGLRGLARAPSRLMELWRDLAPFVIGSAYSRTDTIVDRLLASFLPAGAITCLGVGNKLTVSLSALTVAGVNAVWLPEMSRHTGSDARGNLQAIFIRGLEALLLVCCFVTCLMPFFSADVLTLLLRRGEFNQAGVNTLTSVVLGLTGLFLAGSLGSLTASCFYSQGEMRVPNLIIAFAFTVTVGLRMVGMRSYGVVGLAVATSIGSVISLILQLWVIRRRWKLFSWGWLSSNLLRYGGAGLLAAGSAALATRTLPLIPRSVLGCLLAGLLYAALLTIVGGDIPRAALKRVRERVWRGASA